MSDYKTALSLEDLYKEYNRILDAVNSNQISMIHAQGALAYLELKAKDSNIVFVSPELNHKSKNYLPVEGIPGGIVDAESSDYYDESSSEEVSDMFPDDYTDETHVTPVQDTAVGEEKSKE